MEKNCVDQCKFRDYDNKTCSKNPNGYQEWFAKNGRKLPSVDVFDQMDCHEPSDLSKSYDRLMSLLLKLEDVIDGTQNKI
jgi:hypothetical protein